MTRPASSERPKICIISTTPLVVHFFLKQHIRELAKFAEILLLINPENDSYTPALDLPIRMLPVQIKRRISIKDDCIAITQLLSILHREKPDVVWAIAPKAGLLGMLAAYLVGIRLRVFIFQGEVWAKRTGIMRLILKTADRISAFCATHLLAVSHSEAQFLEDQHVVPAGKTKVLGSGSISGVNLSRFTVDNAIRANSRAQYDIPEGAVVCLFLGRLTIDKGVFDLAASFAQICDKLPNLWLVFAGPEEDDAVEIIQTRCQAAAERLRITGFTTNPAATLAMADFICLPSYREGFGMVVLEAAAMGIPAIGSRIYGIVDAITENKTGLLFAVTDVQDLAEKICQLTQDTALRQQLGQAAQQRVFAEFREEDVVQRYVQYFARLLTDYSK